YNGKNVPVICKKGYAEIATGDKFVIEITLDFSPQFIESDPRVRDNAGKVCLMNGPVVYCLEEVDNGADLYALFVDKNERNFRCEYVEEYGMKMFSCQGIRKKIGGALYAQSYAREKVNLTFIPYYAFANREESDMLVWVNAMERVSD
ncbi:MAG: glycoside hydrolase family 127 protein, partial [Clostridia bacterium]|nr:glycoside hydrolase family 127 protein [Clostridia bacterium]